MRDSLAGGSIHLAMGTYGVAAIRTLAEAHAKAGQVLVAGPVLGRPDLAASGQLGIVAAGPQESVKGMRALADVDRRRTFQSGTKPETATAIKLANNMVLGAVIVAGRSIFAGM
jgi:3-hydroxyisobutyrate dehydrogenase-like beta-hydroxyacid dehydrogenase